MDTTARNVELLVVEKWRVATRSSSSGSRCYIAAVSGIASLRNEKGGFSTEDDFNSFWRSKEVKASKREEWQRKRTARAKRSSESGGPRRSRKR